MFISRNRISSMALGAFAVPALAIFLIGRNEPTYPDLVPKSLSIDAKHILTVTFKNEGDAEVPANVGSLAIFIDGKPIEVHAFGTLADQSFRSPNGTTSVRTKIRMSGANRRVAVVLDSRNQIVESNEFQNTMSPPPIKGPDFIVSRLALRRGNVLAIEVKNIGTAKSPAKLSVHMQVNVNKVVAAELTPLLPVLAADGGTTRITPDPPIIVAPGSAVCVILKMNNLWDEIDNTNDVRENILPRSLSLGPYAALLAQPVIADNIIWQGAGGVASYPAWTVEQKRDLNSAILALEAGSPQTLAVPPSLLEHNFISISDAWAIFLAHVAQSLWVEVHHRVSWHLSTFPPSQLAFLLDSRKLMTYNAGWNSYKFEEGVMGAITAWNPRICYEFLTNLGMIKRGSQLETIYAFADWIRGHVVHFTGDIAFLEQYGYAGQVPVDKILYPFEGKHHVSTGCSGTTGLFGAVLRSVNIPVERMDINFFNQPHVRPSFPSVDRSMPHGDDPYDATLTPSGGIISFAEIFYSGADMNAKFLNPTVDCVGGNCNTVDQQALYNSIKDHYAQAYAVFADHLLSYFAQYGEAGLDGLLRGPFGSASVSDYVQPFFTPDERAAMIAAIQTKVTEIGGGDLDAGKAIVMARWNRFDQNR